jgi:hypothetical protein
LLLLRSLNVNKRKKGERENVFVISLFVVRCSKNEYQDPNQVRIKRRTTNHLVEKLGVLLLVVLVNALRSPGLFTSSYLGR